MALKIDQGLFSSDFTDHHAILGVPVDATPKDIRKRYLKIARLLHPDSSALKTAAEKQLAHELLSKLVNPAYEKLTQEKEQAEYNLLLKLKGKQANQQQDTVVLTSQAAGKLAGTANFSAEYTSALGQLSTKQYETLAETLDITGQISELNLVYLMKQAQVGNGSNQVAPPPTPVPTPVPTPGPTPTPGPPRSGFPPTKPSREEIIKRYLDRSANYEVQNNFPEAIRELREALKFEPKSGECHSRLGNVYMKAKQHTMAKVHFNQALKLNPNDTVAQAAMRRLDPNAKVPSTEKSTPDKKAKGNGKASGGLFGLFGSKKK
ncbi:MAG: tetratricopeptide repeat protein [Cyanothece sp. SIO2G6]|nr:tetratricopeptide repeat protein [Cyanothece sp. SIO2G6]